MEGESNDPRNNVKCTSKACPIAWITLTVVTVVLACFSGVAGYIATMLSPDIVPELLPFYIQCGTTLLMFIISICETVIIVTLVRWMKCKLNINKRGRNETAAIANPFQEATLQNGPFISYREFSACDILGIYVGVIGINIGIVLVIWCITLAESYNSQFNGSLWPFIIIDVVTGLVSPMLIIFSIIPIARIVRYVSHNRLETRKLLLWFLPFLGYEKGSKGVYWVLEDSFYYKVHNGFCGGLSTALIYTTAGLTFLFSWVYFIDDVFIKQTGLNNCMQLSPIEMQTTYCFHIHPTNLNMYINCTANNSYSDHLFCFEFKDGGNMNVIQSLVISIILYYISVICISLTFQIMKFLQHYAHSYLWSTFIVIIGFSVMLFGVLHFASSLYFKYYLNVLTLFQILIISVNIIVVGILIAGGQLMHDQQSFSENTSIMLNSYRVNGDIFTVNQDDMEFIQPPNIPPPEDVTNDIPDHPADHLTPQDTPLPISDVTPSASLPPPSLPPPSPSNSLPPPSSTPPLTSQSILETSSNQDHISVAPSATSDSLVKDTAVMQQQQIADVKSNQTIHAASDKMVIPRTVYVTNHHNPARSIFQMQRPSIPGDGRAVSYIPVSPNYVVLTDQRSIRVPAVQYAVPSQAVVPMPVFIPNGQQSSITGPGVTEHPKRITIV